MKKNNLSHNKFFLFISRFSLLLSVLYIIIVLFLIYIFTKFKFSNGTSVFYIIILFIGPIFIYIIRKSIKIENKLKLKRLQRDFYECILKDYHNNTLDNFLVTPLREIIDTNLVELDNSIKIILGKTNFICINFTDKETQVSINESGIIYHFYYYNVIDKITDFDEMNLHEYKTIVLYKKIYNLVLKLINTELYITECIHHKKTIGYIIKDKDNNILYDDISNANIKYKEKKSFKLIIK